MECIQSVGFGVDKPELISEFLEFSRLSPRLPSCVIDPLLGLACGGSSTGQLLINTLGNSRHYSDFTTVSVTDSPLKVKVSLDFDRLVVASGFGEALWIFNVRQMSLPPKPLLKYSHQKTKCPSDVPASESSLEVGNPTHHLVSTSIEFYNLPSPVPDAPPSPTQTPPPTSEIPNFVTKTYIFGLESGEKGSLPQILVSYFRQC